MEKGFMDSAASSIFKKPMSPCGVVLLNGSRKIVGHLIYNVSADVGIPVKYDDSLNSIYEEWKLAQAPLDLKKKVYMCTTSGGKPIFPCGFSNCVCSGTAKKIPYNWVQNRGSCSSVCVGHHWLEEICGVGRTSDLFSADTLTIAKLPVDKIKDLGEAWKTGWQSNHPYFLQQLEGNVNHTDVFRETSNDKTVKFEDLPLEVFEVLVKYLNGVSAINLCDTSSLMESKVMEAFHAVPTAKRAAYWYKLCVEDLNRATICKIWASYDSRIISQKFGSHRNFDDCLWENLFVAYRRYWSKLANGDVCSKNLHKFENKLKGEILLLKQFGHESEQILPSRITKCAGGRILFNVLFPCPVGHLNQTNLVVVENMDEVNCRHVAPICRNSAISSCFSLKMLYYPTQVEDKPPCIDRVLIGVCDHCITTTTIQGCATRRMELKSEYSFVYEKMDPIVEIHDNIVAVWLHPGHCVFYIMVRVEATVGGGYDLRELYRLSFPEMIYIWNTIVTYRLDYIPVIREYKGNTDMLNDISRRLLVQGGGYLFDPLQPKYYGFAVVSPIYGIESFKPSEQCGASVIVESFEPQYHVKNGRKYLPAMCEITCRGKGHGVFVFFSNTAIGVSWDCITWLFDKLVVPASIIEQEGQTHVVKHVEIIHDTGLLAVIDENIVLMNISLQSPRGVHDEPLLEVRPVRVFNLGLLPVSMEITQLELHFDEGNPFFFVIAERKRVEREFQDRFGFIMKRIDFLD